MSDPIPPSQKMTPAAAVQRCQDLFAHAWMVRTFVKHSPEVEDFPELMAVARTVFDISLSLESRIGDPPAYFRQLGKKFRKLREATEQFRIDAPVASDHTNFRMAVQSMEACVRELEVMLKEQSEPRVLPRGIAKPSAGNIVSAEQP